MSIAVEVHRDVDEECEDGQGNVLLQGSQRKPGLPLRAVERQG